MLNEVVDMRKIIKNAIQCKLCGEIIESTDRHQYVPCKCGACAVDGGHDYLRRSCKDKDCYTDLSVTVPLTEYKIERLSTLFNPTTTLADTFYETLEDIGAIKYHYYDYMTTAPINADEELKRLPSADYDLCCALITMLLREDHFSNGSFDERFKNGDVSPIVEKMIALLKESTED